VLGRDDLRDVEAAENLLARVARDLRARAVDGEVVAFEVVRVDDVVGVLQQRAVTLLAAPHLLLRRAHEGRVALRAPRAEHPPALQRADEVVEEVAAVPGAVHFDRLGVGQAVARAYEGAQVLDVRGVFADEQVAEPRAEQLLGALEAVHARGRVVALGEIAVSVEEFYLFVFGERCGDGLLKLEAPDAFGAVGDEGAVALLALPERALYLFGRVWSGRFFLHRGVFTLRPIWRLTSPPKMASLRLTRRSGADTLHAVHTLRSCSEGGKPS
jgi:hypothetical protein